MSNVRLYIFCGIPFSGKTTVAKKLVDKLGYVRVDLDKIKFNLFGKDVMDEEIDQSGWDRIYQKMYQIILELLKQDKIVICDTGNFTKYERGLVRDIADKLGLGSKTVFVNTPREVARQRWFDNKNSKLRFDISENSFNEAVAEMEIPEEIENVIVYKEGEDLEKWIKSNFD